MNTFLDFLFLMLPSAINLRNAGQEVLSLPLLTLQVFFDKLRTQTHTGEVVVKDH